MEIYRNLPSPDFVNVCQCLMFLDDSGGVAGILGKLIQGAPAPTHTSAGMGVRGLLRVEPRAHLPERLLRRGRWELCARHIVYLQARGFVEQSLKSNRPCVHREPQRSEQ